MSIIKEWDEIEDQRARNCAHKRAEQIESEEITQKIKEK